MTEKWNEMKWKSEKEKNKKNNVEKKIPRKTETMAENEKKSVFEETKVNRVCSACIVWQDKLL